MIANISNIGFLGLLAAALVVLAAVTVFVLYHVKQAKLPSFRKIEAALTRMEEIQGEVEDKQEELKQLREQEAALRLANAESRKERERHEEWERNVKEQLRRLGMEEATIQEMQDRKSKAIEDLKEQEGLLNQANVKLAEAEKRDAALLQEREKMEEARKELEKLEASVRELKENRDKLLEETKELNERKTLLGEITTKLEEAQRILAREEAELTRLKAEKEEIQKTLEELRKDLKQLEVVSDKTKDALEKYKEEAVAQEQRAKEREAKVKSLDGEIEDLTNEDARLDGEIDRKKDLLKGFNDDLAAREKQLEEVMSRLEEALANMTTAMESTGGMVDAMLQTSGVELPSVEMRLRDWSRPHFEVNGSDPIRFGSEEKALEALGEHVEQNGFRFDDRVLKSFHTSLKVNAFSPMTVLAGISGTGKSQLPRLYAESMGVHFLPLAVQPRWDSPQDLLGFYNYVENRFKATDLSRALRQFDRFGKDGGGDLKEHVMLVLLDEMNLARVEYYFSDFLSKLENRDPDKEDDEDFRRKSELQIEAGPKGKGEDDDEDPGEVDLFRTGIYAGFNVLFVGTMNEDDTTQTLSDKVLDRANVLRFGRPDKLKVAQGEAEDGDEKHLLFKDWRSWQKAPLSDNHAWANRLEDLNEKLELVGRPFGHRVFRGILAYLANYPAQGDAGLRDAFADQLEVKIMPKLRGLETRTGANRQVDGLLGEISDLIAETKDEALMEAFKRSRGEDFFSFVGVRR